MADFKNPVSGIYQTILGLVSGNIGVGLKRVQDGDGNDTVLSLGTNKAQFHGDTEAVNGKYSGNLNVTGTITAGSQSGDESNKYTINTYSANHTMVTENEAVILDGDYSILLVPAGDYTGRVVYIKCYGGSVTSNVQAQGGEFIDKSSAEITVNNGAAVVLISDGTGWHRLANFT